MTPKEMVLAAVSHKVSDRTPITFDAEPEVFEALYKHLNFNTREQLFDFLHCDTWMVLPGNYIVPASESGKELKTSIWGWKTVVARYSGGTYDELCHSPLAGTDDPSAIDHYPWPDLSAHDYSNFYTNINSHSDRAIISASSWGAYFIASFIRGMENLMIDFAVNQLFAEKLIRTIAERVVALLRHMLSQKGAEGIDIVYMADDYCSQQAPMFSPESFKRLVVPYLREVVDIAHGHGKKFMLHVCGAVRPLLPMIIDAGVDMIEPIQIRAEGMEPGGLKRDFGKDICFYGGLDLQNVLCCGTPQSVANETKRLIDILGEGGGYVFGPGHTYIQVDAPIENILSMYKTAYEYSRIV